MAFLYEYILEGFALQQSFQESNERNCVPLNLILKVYHVFTIYCNLISVVGISISVHP